MKSRSERNLLFLLSIQSTERQLIDCMKRACKRLCRLHALKPTHLFYCLTPVPLRISVPREFRGNTHFRIFTHFFYPGDTRQC